MRIEAMTAARGERAVDLPSWDRRMQRHIRDQRADLDEFHAKRMPEDRFVALDDQGVVLCWVACIPVSDRCVYAGVVEHSVYVDPDARGQGVGRALLDSLITSTEAAGIWTIQSGVFPENDASIAVHASAGFPVVGTRERLGEHQGR